LNQVSRTSHYARESHWLVQVFILLLSLVPMVAESQPFISDRAYVEQLNLNGSLPEKLLSTRSVVFHSVDFTMEELNEAQQAFQRTGIDAVAYFPIDMLTSGVDVKKAFSDLLTKREIVNIIFLEKGDKWRIVVTTFAGSGNIIESKNSSWSVSNSVWSEALKVLYRSASTSLKKQNLLVNEFPETGITVNTILGKRNEFYAVDLKVDPLGIVKSGDVTFDQELEALLTANYPFKFKLFEPGITEKEMRKQGFYYTLYFIRSRGFIARELLEYSTTKSESAIVSITFPDGQQQQLKNIPSTDLIYKVYLKHIDSQNVFLGNKWDADHTWQQALLNSIRGLKFEMRLN
jgi:hypothetical protein